MVELAPSILSADFAHLAAQVQAAADGGGTIVHVDIMDGHFVPNMTLGPPVVKSLRKFTKLPLDCHLMIENPDQMIPLFAEAGARARSSPIASRLLAAWPNGPVWGISSASILRRMFSRYRGS